MSWIYLLGLTPRLFVFFCIIRIYKDGQTIATDDSLDYGGNFSHMLGFDSPQMQELMRLYLTIHRWVYRIL